MSCDVMWCNVIYVCTHVHIHAQTHTHTHNVCTAHLYSCLPMPWSSGVIMIVILSYNHDQKMLCLKTTVVTEDVLHIAQIPILLKLGQLHLIHHAKGTRQSYVYHGDRLSRFSITTSKRKDNRQRWKKNIATVKSSNFSSRVQACPSQRKYLACIVRAHSKRK